MSEKIPLSFETDSGHLLKIPVIHSVFVGITRVGKSETVKAAVSRSKNVRFLILDVKRPRDYADVGNQIPIYIEEKTEPLMLKRLLESQSHLALKFEFPELLKVCKKASTYPEILTAVNEGLEAKKHPIVKDKLLVLQHLLSRLVKELEKTPISDDLMLKGRVNVMDLSGVSKEMQQLAVHSTLKRLLETWADVVVIADEFHRFAPQHGSNASKETVTTYIKEGGAKNLWLWVIDQTITGVDKQVLKQCWVWILGKQRELNEAKRTLDQIPFKTGLTEKDIMRLKIGHFIVCTEDYAKLSYVWLPDIPKEMAQKVARGELDVREVIDYLKKVREEEEVDLKRIEKIERNLDELAKTVGELVTLVRDHIEDPIKHGEDLRDNIKEINKYMERIHKKVDTLTELEKVRSKLAPGEQGEIQVTIEQAKLFVTKETKTLELKQSDLMGRIAIVYAEGLLPDGWFSTGKLNKIMEQRFGTKEFPGHFKPVMQQLVYYGFLEKKLSGRRPDYKIKMSPETARKKGLLEG